MPDALTYVQECSTGNRLIACCSPSRMHQEAARATPGVVNQLSRCLQMSAYISSSLGLPCHGRMWYMVLFGRASLHGKGAVEEHVHWGRFPLEPTELHGIFSKSDKEAIRRHQHDPEYEL